MIQTLSRPSSLTTPFNRPALSLPTPPALLERSVPLGLVPLRSQALDGAMLLCQAPAPAAPVRAAAPNPLDVVPTAWLPQGRTTRPFQANVGFVTLQSGRATVNRDQNGISVETSQGNFNLAPDPNNPGRVIVDTPQGQFSGTVRRTGNRVEFRTNDGKSVTITRGNGYTRFDTKGFGLADRGHLRVNDR